MRVVEFGCNGHQWRDAPRRGEPSDRQIQTDSSFASVAIFPPFSTPFLLCAGTLTRQNKGAWGFIEACKPQSGVQDHDVYKRRLDSVGKPIDEGKKHEIGPQNDPELEARNNGSYCGSCYGAGSEGECCNTCEEVSSSSACH